MPSSTGWSTHGELDREQSRVRQGIGRSGGGLTTGAHNPVHRCVAGRLPPDGGYPPVGAAAGPSRRLSRQKSAGTVDAERTSARSSQRPTTRSPAASVAAAPAEDHRTSTACVQRAQPSGAQAQPRQALARWPPHSRSWPATTRATLDLVEAADRPRTAPDGVTRETPISGPSHGKPEGLLTRRAPAGRRPGGLSSRIGSWQLHTMARDRTRNKPYAG
jgi:hypothetical protein